MSDHTGVTRHLTELRKQVGISRAELARRMHIGARGAARIESGKHDPRLSTVVAYCNAIGAHIHIGLEEHT